MMLPGRGTFIAISWLVILLPIIAIGTCSYFAFGHETEYIRKDWHPFWEDTDRDCLNTRHEVLLEESVIEVSTSANGCRVTEGLWVDPYSGEVFTDPRDLDVDHLVPLKEAHVSGGSSWSREKKHAYANDLALPSALIAVAAKENRSKGSRDPANWLPSNTKFHCEYVRAWRQVKEKWGLGSDPKETKGYKSDFMELPRG